MGREEKDFFDVTLACDDSQIQAHKVILSACSPFFRNVLRRNPHQHPLLYLKGVNYTNLQSVLNFMYYGEVSVAQEELNSFLSVAEDLNVKGLTQNQPESERRKSNKPQQQIPAKQSHQYSRQGTNHVPDRQHIIAEEVQEVVPVKSEPRDLPTQPVVPVAQDVYQAEDPHYPQHSQVLARDDQQHQEDLYQ